MEERKINHSLEEANAIIPSAQKSGDTDSSEISKFSQFDSIGFDSLYQSIKQASATSTNKRFIKFFNPIFFMIWGLYLVTLAKIARNLRNQLSVKPQHNESFLINGPETIYTASLKAFQGSMPMRFFGIRFLAIWVLPIAITGTIMEVLFVSPLRGVSPFS